MRMHTIPQNVTAYEDRIVGALTGRNFIYLAVAGVVIFILLSTQAGPLLVRLLLSFIIGGFAAALVFYKPNDRNFDGLFLSYIAAMFGPTEWVWRKDMLPMSRLSAITGHVAATTASTTSPTTKRTSKYEQNLQRVSQYQNFLSQKEYGALDEDEVMFMERLNFSEPIPAKAFAAVERSKPAPPMLTKSNYTQVQPAPARPKPAPYSPAKPEPISALAGSTQRGVTFMYNGQQQSIALRSNLRANRSLSRHLLSSGVLPSPIRGEMRIDVSPALKQEITAIKSQMPAPQPAPTTNLAGQTVTQPVPQPPTPATPAIPIPAEPSVTQFNPADHSPEQSKQSASIRNAIDYANDWSKTASIRKQIDALGQSLAVTQSTSASGAPTTDTPTAPPPQNVSQPAATGAAAKAPSVDAVKIIKPAKPQNADITPDVEKQLQQAEDQVKKELGNIESGSSSTASQPEEIVSPVLNILNDKPADTTPAAGSVSPELNSLQQQQRDVEMRIRQSETTLALLQQTSNNPTEIQQQQNLISQLKGELQDISKNISTLEQSSAKTDLQPIQAEASHQMASANNPSDAQSQSQSAGSTIATPAPQSEPAVPQPATPQPAVQPAMAAQPAPNPTPQPAVPQPAPEAPQPAPAAEPQDLQARLSAAGVGSADTVTTAGVPAGVPGSQSMNITLTAEPNIINGWVIDATGQSLPGVVVVVKNAQGEPKRALKTNKLGQFLVTTPLVNGSYTVEVDKKGLSFDIMNVELNGSVLAPIQIKAK